MKNKTIGLDARMWDHPGIGRYIRELSAELIHSTAGEKLAFIGDARPIQQFFLAREGPSFKPFCIPASSRIYSVKEQWEMPWVASRLDLLHVPHFNAPVFLKTKLVVTIHDLIYLHEPGASKSRFGKAYTTALLRVIGKKAAAVITVSEYTKKDLLNHFSGLSPERVFVTHEAPSPLFKKISESQNLQNTRKRYGLLKPFVLFVGTLKAHKNVPTLIHALKVLKDTKGVDHELVLVGRKDEKNKELLSLIRENSFVKYLGELGDSDLALIYNLADAFVLPSFYEGFGLPVIEAMACGTPVIVSDRTSLPEVVGQAGICFDPLRVDALSELLYNVLTDEELRKNMSRMGLERARKFSWRATAQETIKVYQKVLS